MQAKDGKQQYIIVKGLQLMHGNLHIIPMVFGGQQLGGMLVKLIQKHKSSCFCLKIPSTNGKQHRPLGDVEQFIIYMGVKLMGDQLLTVHNFKGHGHFTSQNGIYIFSG